LQHHVRRPERSDIDALGPWFHNLHLPDGRETAPDHPYGDFPRFKWAELAPHLPADLTGWTALDIGCNAGFYSFELARRGARVTGIDREDLYLDQARWAVRAFGLEDRVTFEKAQVHDLAREERRFDLVVFLGVFYHLRYGVLALDTIARLAPRLLVFQSLTMPGRRRAEARMPDDFDFPALGRVNAPDWPKMAFIENRFAGDETNWWMPDHAATVGLLRSAGFRIVASPNAETHVCEPTGAPPPADEEWRAATGAGLARR
jgi:tRNA (mo5U34)-methyltransferase